VDRGGQDRREQHQVEPDIVAAAAPARPQAMRRKIDQPHHRRAVLSPCMTAIERRAPSARNSDAGQDKVEPAPRSAAGATRSPRRRKREGDGIGKRCRRWALRRGRTARKRKMRPAFLWDLAKIDAMTEQQRRQPPRTVEDPAPETRAPFFVKPNDCDCECDHANRMRLRLAANAASDPERPAKRMRLRMRDAPGTNGPTLRRVLDAMPD
jgi:hypothetical protein